MSLLHELPFHSPKSPKSTPFDVAELLRGGHQNHKLPLDGIIGFHAIRFASSNARETARFFEMALGFKEVAYRGLESASVVLAAHVLKKGSCVFELVNTLGRGDLRPGSRNRPGSRARAESRARPESKYSEKLPVTFQVRGGATSFSELAKAAEQLTYDAQEAADIDRFVSDHGMGVFDISFEVTDAESAFKRAVAAGAPILRNPVLVEDEQGSVKVAVVGVPGSDLRHTLVQKVFFKGPFLPLFRESMAVDLPDESSVPILAVDHCVQNFTWDEMMPYAQFYASAFGLHKFWSADEQDVSTGATALKSIVMSSANGAVKMPINEPAKGTMKGQIEEFYEFYKGPGVQHIALRTRDILQVVKAMRSRGFDFNNISEAYYDNLRERLDKDNIELFESFDELKQNHILVDFDPATKYKNNRGNGKNSCHYILQIFTKPLHDRPTLFLEVIQRHHHNGFGKGTFKGLFETIEAQQRLRGTLVPSSLM